MSIFRSGLLLATLFLSACSMPIFKDFQLSKSENNAAQDNTNTQSPAKASNGELPTVQTSVITTPHGGNLAEQFAAQETLARNNYQELKNRMGNATPMPKLAPADKVSNKQLKDNIQTLRTYVSQTNTEIAQLDARVEEREKVAMNGDVIRVFLSEATVTHGSTTFKAQPIVGQWVRGESRTIRLKDSFLFESDQSEDVHITFSESYQLLINNQVISTVNPKRSKNEANFTVPSKEAKGSLIGKLDYRIIEKK